MTTVIFLKNFNNYVYALECLFTINKNREKTNNMEMLIWHGDVKSVVVYYF